MKHFFLLTMVLLLVTGVAFAYESIECDDNNGCLCYTSGTCGGCLGWELYGYNFGNTFENVPKTLETYIACMAANDHYLEDVWLVDCTYDDEWEGVVLENTPYRMSRWDTADVEITFSPNTSLHGTGIREATVVFWYSQVGFPNSCWYCVCYLEGYAKPGSLFP